VIPLEILRVRHRQSVDRAANTLAVANAKVSECREQIQRLRLAVSESANHLATALAQLEFPAGYTTTSWQLSQMHTQVEQCQTHHHTVVSSRMQCERDFERYVRDVHQAQSALVEAIHARDTVERQISELRDRESQRRETVSDDI
jgi:chromosome segregation ATPase